MTDFLPELLAPAGSREAALAALANGADAIYLGAASFGARAAVGFDETSLQEITELFHFYGKRVYVTLNTLIKEKELEGVRQTLKMLERLQVDAVLVQDMGVLQLIREEFPALCIHASTQMSIHNAQGARFLQSLGVTRAVLARECTLDAIRATAATGIETEVFVHGAQCVCVSGQCRYSGLIGGRSGNRGRCAQPCRLQYDWQGDTGAWLSPRDLCLRDNLDALCEAGVHTLKIEGRLKRPEYVAVITRAYRRALDSIAQKCFSKATLAEKEEISQVFTRGFYSGYAFNARDAQVINPRRVMHEGIPMGRVKRMLRKGNQLLCEVLLERELNNGDGLQLRGAREQDLIYSGPDVKAGQTATLRVHHSANPGDMAVRIDSEKQLRAARECSTSDRLPRISFDAVLTVHPGAAATLTVCDDRAQASVTGDTVQAAQNAALDEARARKSLEKTGDTAYTLQNLTVVGENAYLPAASLNALRREALTQLRTARIAAYRRQTPPAYTFDQDPADAAAEKPLVFVQCCHAQWADALLRAGADRFIYAPCDLTEPAFSRELSLLPKGAYVALPVQLSDQALTQALQAIADHGLLAAVGSIGQIDQCREKAPAEMMTTEGVPVWNRKASDFLRARGAAWQVLPRELTGSEIEDFSEAADARFILPVYGRARLMYLNHCPARTAKGLSAGRENCRLCEKGQGCIGQSLTDRRGEAFPLLPVRMPEGCLVQLLSNRVRNLGEKALPRMHCLLDFTLESKEEALDILRAWREGKAVSLYTERFEQGVE
ncbi:MAG: U32 family peptidase [Clostridia bacterium]|nr:U32 family peptidase [Clostridia bacterium]